MIRKLKALGAAMFALLALGAMASAAQASHLDFTSGSSGFLHGEQTNTHVFTLTDNSNVTTTCTKATFSAVGEGSKDGDSTIVMHPEYSGHCTAFGLNATVNTAGCNYEFHIGENTGAAGFDGTVDVECGAGAIVITAATCEVKVDTQQALNAGTATNSGTSSAMDLTLHTNATKIGYTVTKDGIGCPLKGVGTYTEGDYTGTTTVTASGGVTLTG